MSADNYLEIRRSQDRDYDGSIRDDLWVVCEGTASAAENPGYKPHVLPPRFPTRDSAVEWAVKHMQENVVEYGISYIEPLERPKTLTDTELQQLESLLYRFDKMWTGPDTATIRIAAEIVSDWRTHN